MNPTPPPTAQFGAYQNAYNYFNETLFENSLNLCLLNFSRKSKALGFFAPEGWSDSTHYTYEINLNPNLLERPLEDIFSTLVHEMAHQWQQDCGTPSKGGYHNREWSDKMIVIGLIPSDTAQPGGKKTGSSMSHYTTKMEPSSGYLRLCPMIYGCPG